ncbi:MAG TPA: hypothetical protein DCZ10_07590 [Pelotomaculum sp.]|nr:hypothetical protein [Pelotomaculum sp.]
MLFKKSVLVSAAMFATVSLVGCGAGAPQDAASTTPAAQTQQANGQTANGMALPADKPAYTAKVADVANDQVTIYKAEPAAEPQGGPQGTNQGAPQGEPQGRAQGAPQGGDEKGPGPGGQMKLSEQADTIIIPASAQVVTGGPGGGDISSIKVSDLKKDQIIQVWEKDGAITFVQVMDNNRNMPNDGVQQQGGQ